MQTENMTFTESFEGFRFQVFSSRPSFDLIEVNQVHGNKVYKADGNLDLPFEADGIVTTNTSHSLAIKTADCLPIAIIGRKGFAHLHAGWRGVQQKIIQDSSLKHIDPFFFYIGPHIQKKDFEVQKEFKSNFPSSRNFTEQEDRLCFDLSAEVRQQIEEIYPKAKIEISLLSTYSDDRFHSYRLDGTKERNWNILSKD